MISFPLSRHRFNSSPFRCTAERRAHTDADIPRALTQLLSKTKQTKKIGPLINGNKSKLLDGSCSTAAETK